MVQVFARQLGTKNEAKAQFDSRTGEVIGWTSLSKEESHQFLADKQSSKIENMYETDKDILKSLDDLQKKLAVLGTRDFKELLTNLEEMIDIFEGQVQPMTP